MTRPILPAASLAAVPPGATPVDGAATLSQDIAGETDFERIARTPLAHTPEWTNPVASDPGAPSPEAFVRHGEATAYQAAARPAGSTVGHDVEWKYVNVRRYLAHLTESIGKGIAWAVFEPNGAAAWDKVRAAVSDLLLREWQSGALKGARPDEAFFVKCDRSTMTQDDLDKGRLVVLVGAATVKPAEVVILRFSHKMAES